MNADPVILPPSHAHLAAAPPRVSKRERWMIGGVLGVVAALALAVAISLVAASPRSGHGCIYVTIPAATGAQEIDQCGVAARSTCASARESGTFTAQARATVAAECRKAGLPVGRS